MAFDYALWLKGNDLTVVPEDVTKGILSPRQLLRNRRAAQKRRKGEKAKADHLAFLAEMTADQAGAPTWTTTGPHSPPKLLARMHQHEDEQAKMIKGYGMWLEDNDLSPITKGWGRRLAIGAAVAGAAAAGGAHPRTRSMATSGFNRARSAAVPRVASARSSASSGLGRARQNVSSFASRAGASRSGTMARRAGSTGTRRTRAAGASAMGGAHRATGAARARMPRRPRP